MDPDTPAHGISDLVTNLIIHAGDTIVTDPFSHGRYEYRFFDQGGTHYATLAGHHNPNGDFVVDAIAYHPHVGERRKLLSVRPQPQPDPVTIPDSNSITVTQPPGTFLGDPNVTTYGTSPRVTIAHEHDHPHTRTDDALAFAYWHAHPHEHSGVGTIWLAEHTREAHDHPHPDDDEPDRRPAG